MYKGSDISGKKVVVYNEGEQIARVKDLIFDHRSNQVIGFLVDEGGWFGKPKVVSVEAVRAIGPDSVVITAQDAIVTAEESPKICSVLEQKIVLKNTKIMTTGGHDLGTFLDIYFDEKTWNIVGYEVSGGLFADMYSGRSFLPTPFTLKIGKDYAFVEDDVVERMKEHTGGLESVMEATGEKLQAFSEHTGEQVKSVKVVASENLHAVTRPAGEKLQNARQVVGAAWQDTVDKTSETVQSIVLRYRVEDAKGRRAKQRVQTQTGIFIVAPGQIVSEAVIAKAKEHHEEAALLEVVGLTAGEAIKTETQGKLSQSGKQLKADVQTMGEQLRENLGELEGRTRKLWNKTKESAAEFQSETAQTFESRRIQGALGHRVSRAILDEQDRIILNEAAIITHESIERARTAGVLSMLLSSVDHSPVTRSMSGTPTQVEIKHHRGVAENDQSA